jgi:5'-methylthioadenosine phosphorylase
MCLCGILNVTDYDCWYDGEEDVSVASVVENLKKNDKNMANIIKKLIPRIKYERTCECHNALKHAVITSPELIEKHGNPWVNRVLLKRVTK